MLDNIIIFIVLITLNNACCQEKKWQYSDTMGNFFYINADNEISKNKEGIYYGDYFVLSDASKKKTFYYDVYTNYYKTEFHKDTLHITEIYELCFGNRFDCIDTEIIRDSYYFEKGELKHKKHSLLSLKNKISQKTIATVHKTIDHMEYLYTNDIQENLNAINLFIKKLEILAIYGDLKSFLKLIALNKENNTEFSFASRKSSRIILDLNYINTQKNSIQRNLMNYLVNDLH